MSMFSKISLALILAAIPLSEVAKAEKKDQIAYCKLTVQEAENDQYSIFVPQSKIDQIKKKLDVVGINCRNENRFD